MNINKEVSSIGEIRETIINLKNDKTADGSELRSFRNFMNKFCRGAGYDW